jgi:hypothetical protein
MAKFAFDFAGTRDEAVEQVRKYFFGKYDLDFNIRTKQHNGKFHYQLYVDNGPGGPVSYTKLTLETAKKQLGMYTKDSEPTVVTQEVTITESGWEEVEMSEIKLLAHLLHEKQCRHNHIDQCDWAYDINTPTHFKYEEKAKAILEKTSFETAKELLEIL